METIPNEIIEYILINPTLNHIDIVSFSSTCSKFREFINSNRSLWKIKYFQRWPKTDFEIFSEDWFNEYKSRDHFDKKVLELLSSMSKIFYRFDLKNINSSQLNFAVNVVSSYKYGYYYLRDFLAVLNSLPLTQSLTHKYYGNILLKNIHKKHCQEIWSSLVQLNDKEQTLEKGAIFVSLWCQEHEQGIWKSVTSELDSTADLVRRHVLQQYKDHPLNNTSEETRLKWRNEILIKNMFEPEHCKTLISAINYILFGVLKFCVAYDFNDLDRKRCGIDSALVDRKANPIIFAVIYESTARRLGVKIEILEFPGHCLLRWKEDYSVENSRTHCINTNSERIFLNSMCPRKSSGNVVMKPCDMQQVAQRSALYVYPREQGESHLSVRDALELVLVIKPFSLECYQQLSRLYMLHDMDAKEVIWKMKEIQNRFPTRMDWRLFGPLLHSLEMYQQNWDHNHGPEYSRTPVVHEREKDVHFAVGMIVRDKFHDRTGVIYGWTVHAEAPEISLQVSSRVMYNVLVDDGSYQCLPQENLQILHTPPFIFHPSIGRFFSEYCTTYYKPNKELEAEFPKDMEALEKILKKDRQTLP